MVLVPQGAIVEPVVGVGNTVTVAVAIGAIAVVVAVLVAIVVVVEAIGHAIAVTVTPRAAGRRDGADMHVDLRLGRRREDERRRGKGCGGRKDGQENWTLHGGL